MRVENHILNQVHVTAKALERGVDKAVVIKFLTELIAEYKAYPERQIDVSYTDYSDKSRGVMEHLTIFGVFEPNQTHARVCICLVNELKKGKRSEWGRLSHYPDKAPIATTFVIVD